MLKFILGTVFLLGIINSSKAQLKVYSITGTICDTITKKVIPDCFISLNNSSASLKQTTFTTQKGSFVFQVSDTSNYYLTISNIGYGPKNRKLTFYGLSINLDTIFLLSKNTMLKEVVIKGAQKINKDTTEFYPSDFKVDINSFTKELFQQIPGMTLSRNGILRFQGEQITKFLVDGEPFFEDGPSTALEFLRSGAISKIQVYRANNLRVVNIILKPNARKGYFGGLEAIGGINHIYGIQGTANSFNKKMRIGVSGLFNSIGNARVSWTDPKDVQLSNGVLSGLNALPSFLSGSNFGYRGSGIPKTTVSNLFYSDKWSNSQLKVEYHNSFSATNSVFSIIKRNTLPGIGSENSELGTNAVNKSGHDLTVELNFNPFKKTQVKLSQQYFFGGYKSDLNFRQATYSNDSVLTSQQQSSQFSQGNMANYLSDVSLSQTISRTTNISASIRYANFRKEGTNTPYVITRLFSNNAAKSIDTLRQHRNAFGNDKSLTITGAYTQRLFTMLTLIINYNFNKSRSNQDVTTNNLYTSQPTTIDSSLSNQSAYTVYNNEIRPALRYGNRRFTIDLGTNYLHSKFIQNDFSGNSSQTDLFKNISPFIDVDVNLGLNRTIGLSYSNTAIRPTILQRQRIAYNADPLNTYLGNPDLKQGYQHKFKINYRNTNTQKNKNFFGELSCKINANAITDNSIIDSFNRVVTQYININGNYSVDGSSTYSFSTKNRHFIVDINNQFRFNQNVNLINGSKNVNRNFTFLFNPGAFVSTGGIINLNFELRSSILFSRNESTLNLSKVTNFINQEHKVAVSKTLFNIIDFYADGNFQINARTNKTDKNNNIYVINTAATIHLLRHQQLLLSLQANDLLNSNKGFNRFTNDYTVTEQTFSVQKRYFMLRAYFKLANKIGKSSGELH